MTLSLQGGPLHRLGCRLGLVRGTNSVPFGLALGVILWAVPVLTAVFEGTAGDLFSLSLIGAHTRLLIVIPLFFVSESLLEPRLRTFVSTLVRSGVVPEASRPALDSEIARTVRRNESTLAEALCLIGAVVVLLIGPWLHLAGTTASFDPTLGLSHATLSRTWYWIVCMTSFRFLALRLLWRLGLWVHFLWRLSKLKLHLVPTHPDGAAGLGYLEVVHMHFIPMVFAISVIQAASLAEEISSGKMVFDGIYPSLAAVIVVDAVLILGPLFLFTPKLWATRIKGLSDYMVFAATYVSGFEKKWLEGDAPPDEPLLGTADVQSLADLGNSINLVRSMRVVPLSLRMLAAFAIVALVPMLPLFLLKYPVTELMELFFKRLAGL